jgi:hypothetical protein
MARRRASQVIPLLTGPPENRRLPGVGLGYADSCDHCPVSLTVFKSGPASSNVKFQRVSSCDARAYYEVSPEFDRRSDNCGPKRSRKMGTGATGCTYCVFAISIAREQPPCDGARMGAIYRHHRCFSQVEGDAFERIVSGRKEVDAGEQREVGQRPDQAPAVVRSNCISHTVSGNADRRRSA